VQIWPTLFPGFVVDYTVFTTRGSSLYRLLENTNDDHWCTTLEEDFKKRCSKILVDHAIVNSSFNLLSDNLQSLAANLWYLLAGGNCLQIFICNTKGV